MAMTVEERQVLEYVVTSIAIDMVHLQVVIRHEA